MDTFHPEIKTLNAKDFSPYGDVIETADRPYQEINDGTAKRFHDLADLDLLADNGLPLLNIFRATPYTFPIQVKMLEQHPLSSQAFIPLGNIPFLVVVAEKCQSLQPDAVRVFVTDGKQGVNYHRGVWHHPLIALETECDFLVLDRGGEDENCLIHVFQPPLDIVIKSIK